MYCLPNIVRVITSRRLRWAGHVVRVEEGRSIFKAGTVKHSGKRPLRSSRRRWEDAISMDLKKMGINWVDSTQNRDYCRALVNVAVNFRVS